MKVFKVIKDSDGKSYMEMCLNLDGEENRYFRIPTYWDAVKNQWIAAVKLPESQKLISATGKDSFELQNNTNIELSRIFQKQDEISKELFDMFMPAWYWEKTDG